MAVEFATCTDSARFNGCGGFFHTSGDEDRIPSDQADLGLPVLILAQISDIRHNHQIVAAVFRVNVLRPIRVAAGIPTAAAIASVGTETESELWSNRCCK